jgi:hypothetical protein
VELPNPEGWLRRPAPPPQPALSLLGGRGEKSWKFHGIIRYDLWNRYLKRPLSNKLAGHYWRFKGIIKGLSNPPLPPFRKGGNFTTF